MEFNMRRNLIWSSAIVLSLVISSFSFGQEVVIDFRNLPGTTGELLDNAPLSDLPPFVVVPEATSLGLEFDLELEVFAGSDVDDATLNSNDIEFGIASGGSDNATEFNSAQNEFFEISFSEDVFILEADLNDLFGPQEFIRITGGFFSDLSNSDVAAFDDPLNNDREIRVADTVTVASEIFDFTFGGAVPGLQLDFGQTLRIEAGTSAGGFSTGSAALQTLTISVPSATPVVPEPNSLFALMGLAGLITARRRR